MDQHAENRPTASEMVSLAKKKLESTELNEPKRVEQKIVHFPTPVKAIGEMQRAAEYNDEEIARLKAENEELKRQLLELKNLSDISEL